VIDLGKATAVAHAIQGLVKYHGLKDKRRRVPFHDSVSVCVEKLTTTSTFEFNDGFSQDTIEINGKPATTSEAVRVLAVVSPLRRMAKSRGHFRLSSANSLLEGKGLGFSASAFASIALASSQALGLQLGQEHLSEIARLGAGSASRSLVGGLSIWYADRNGRSYAKQIAPANSSRLVMGIIPIPSQVKTELAHEESVHSPFFQSRLREVRRIVPRMLRAIRNDDIDSIGKLTEAESLSLHAVTMTGKDGLLLMAPQTLQILQEVRRIREVEGLPVWYSLDTGPSVYLNTYQEHIEAVCRKLETARNLSVLRSRVGGPARVTDSHLF